MRRCRARVARRVGLRKTEDMWASLGALLEAGNSSGVAEALTQSHDDPAVEELYLEALRDTSLNPKLADGVQNLLNNYLAQGFDESNGYAAAITGLLDVGALRGAMQIFARSQESGAAASLPEELHRRMLHVLGSCGQLHVALSHIHSLLDADSPQPTHFNAFLSGLANGRCSDRGLLAARVISIMGQAGVVPDSLSLALYIDTCTYEGHPGFLTNVGSTALTFARQFGVLPKGDALLSICSAHLRSGDLEAAYQWFLASQLAEEPLQLHRGASAHTMEIVSQLARAFAVHGQATRLQRLLERISGEGGRLPASASSVSLAGYSCGRTMATIWLEPPAEVLRRRAVWSSDGSTKVMCAQQYSWRDLDKQRHEASQWLPYLAPDVKLERAWLMPLRATDHGALGLVRDWWGEGPAAAAARERLNEDLQSNARASDIDAALQRALQLELPKPAGGIGSSGGAYVCPELKTWRMNHADSIRRAFFTPSRIRASSTSNFREVLLNDDETRLLVPNAPPRPKTFTKEQMASLQEQMLTMPENDVKMLESLASEEKVTAKKLKEVCEELGLTLPKSASKAGIVAFLVTRSWDPEFKPRYIPAEHVEEHIGNLEEATLSELWQRGCGATANDGSTAASGTGGLMGEELGSKVATELQQERLEDQRLEGSAEDELRLAANIVKVLHEVGVSVSRADGHALCAAAHAVNNPQLAADILRVLPREAVLPPAESEQPKLGPAGQRLAVAMVRGGWELQSTSQFLLGERPMPRRAGGVGLGGLATRFLDPLLGYGQDDEHRAELLEILTVEAEENVTLDSYADTTISVTTMYGEEMEITAAEVLAMLFKNSRMTEEVLMVTGQHAKKTETDMEALALLGLPVNLSSDDIGKLMDFTRSIWSKVKRMKAAAEQKTETM
eukprot:CAMPEP_0172923208 /NCGR_PEP_ID=MMETSP1075-20121228/209290_1 /TAXON_ID=2916 /ORGANISM="Ceratium fusus, Strain PA161109" /LENGTH=904 /DNA_ID=CAMNT_0013783649 /DNA_START=206 /DNA_END=2917 /DNA_ORIENTATION=-